jgi:glutathione S-transferase
LRLNAFDIGARCASNVVQKPQQTGQDIVMIATALPLTSLVTLAMLLTYFWTGILVGQSRAKHGLQAPTTSGPDAFNRVMRAHINTLEQLVLMLPALWLFAMWVSDRYAALLGLVWIAGRVLYVISYSRDADSRGPGFGIGFAAFAIAAIGAAIQIVRSLI